MNTKTWRYWLPLCLVLPLAGCAKEELTSAKVERRDVVGYEMLNGAIAFPPSAKADIYSPFTAPVEKVNKSVGDPVNRGEVIVQLSIPSAEASIDQAQEYVRQAQEALSDARRSLGVQVEQAEEAYNQAREAERAARANMDEDLDALTQSRVAAETALKAQRAQLETQLMPYKQQLEDAQEYLADARSGARQGQIRSPITGTVMAINAQPGAQVGDRETPVAVVMNLAEMQIHAPMAPEQQSKFDPGTNVTVTFKEVPDREFSGEIARITTSPNDDGDLAYTAIIEFANTDAIVKPDMTVTMVGIKTGEKEDVLAVPNDAIDKDDSGRPIVRVLEGDKWVPRIVELGLTGMHYTEITSGLKEGETIQVKES